MYNYHCIYYSEYKVNPESIHEMDLKFVSFIHWDETRNIAREIS